MRGVELLGIHVGGSAVAQGDVGLWATTSTIPQLGGQLSVCLSANTIR